jgi:FMN phosphatase YigB (HAD superfamily)
MIVDNAEADIGGGRDAGMQTVWLSRGRTWPISDFHPDHHATDPAVATRFVISAGLPAVKNTDTSGRSL